MVFKENSEKDANRKPRDPSPSNGNASSKSTIFEKIWYREPWVTKSSQCALVSQGVGQSSPQVQIPLKCPRRNHILYPSSMLSTSTASSTTINTSVTKDRLTLCHESIIEPCPYVLNVCETPSTSTQIKCSKDCFAYPISQSKGSSNMIDSKISWSEITKMLTSRTSTETLMPAEPMQKGGLSSLSDSDKKGSGTIEGLELTSVSTGSLNQALSEIASLCSNYETKRLFISPNHTIQLKSPQNSIQVKFPRACPQVKAVSDTNAILEMRANKRNPSNYSLRVLLPSEADNANRRQTVEDKFGSTLNGELYQTILKIRKRRKQIAKKLREIEALLGYRENANAIINLANCSTNFLEKLMH